jgi:hypothetical protein
VIVSIVAAVLFTMTIADANVVRPAPAAADVTEPAEHLAHERHAERSGTLSFLPILY